MKLTANINDSGHGRVSLMTVLYFNHEPTRLLRGRNQQTPWLVN